MPRFVGGPLLRAAPLLACVVAALAGCGNSRTSVPSSVMPAMPDGFRTLTFARQDVALSAPRNWSVIRGKAPLVSRITSGAAVVALWRFGRDAKPPAGQAALRRLERQLVRDSRARDAGLRVIHTALSTVGGDPAIELDALERIGGQARRVRSTHLFEPRAEVVLDEYAPPQVFRAVNHAVFAPVKRSLSPIPATA